MASTEYEQAAAEAAADVNTDVGFAAAMRAAEAEVGIGPGIGGSSPPEEATEPGPEAEAVEPLQVQMAQPAEEDTPQLLAGKYKSVEELERAYQEAQQAIGRQGTELAQERQARAQYEWALQAQQQARPQQQYVAPSLDQFEMLAEENPVQAVHMARELQNPMLYERAMQAWYEQNPRDASRFENAIMLEQAQAQARAQLQPQLQAATQARAQQAMNQALTLAMDERPDFAQVIGSLGEDGVPAMFRGNATAIRVVGEALASGDVAQMKDAYSFVYDMAKARQVSSLPEAAQQAAEQARAQARTDKVAASVASAAVTTPPETPETEQERFAAFLKREDATSMRANWKGQETRR